MAKVQVAEKKTSSTDFGRRRGPRKHPLERFLSMVVHAFAFLMLCLMILYETIIYTKHPTATSVEDDMYPVQKIDFPGVAICNMNVISRRKAHQFAEELWQMESVREIENLTLEAIKTVTKYMGHLYLFENTENEPGEAILLHEILLKAFKKNYNVLKIMHILIPKCQNLLKHCSWQGEIRSCGELFVPRWTQDGQCCTFNYIKWTDDFNGEPNANFKFEIERSEVTGMEHGLWVLVDAQLDDYYYTLLPGKGVKVLIYTASDYPDAPSGGLREILVTPGSESFLSLKPTSFYSSPDVISYDKSKRQCLFNTELKEEYEGSYSYSQCMMLCRTRDILRLCNCIPFFYPLPDGIGKAKTCDFEDLDCLERNKYKWWSVEPIQDDESLKENPYLRDQDEDHLNCDCLPSCENVDYLVFKTGGSINEGNVALLRTESQALANLSKQEMVLSVSFGSSTGSVRLRQDVLYHWYDLMSSYGGLCSLFLGVSIITPIEFIYSLSLGILRRKRRPRKNDPNLYWNELVMLSK